MNQTLKQKLIKLLDTYYPDDMSDNDIIKDINRRGKIDFKKTVEIIFLIIKEVDELAKTKNIK